jgi:superfamily II DNA or RNA helicase
MDQNVILSKLLAYQVPHTLQLYESIGKQKCILDASDTGTGKTYTAIALCKLLNLRPFIICPKSVINNWVEICDFFDMKLLGVTNYEAMKASKYYTEELEYTTCPYFDKILVSTVKETLKKTVKVKAKKKTVEVKGNRAGGKIGNLLDKIENKKKQPIAILKDGMLDVTYSDETSDEIVEETNDDDTKDEDKKAVKIGKTKEVYDYEFNLPHDTLIILDEAHRCKNHKSSTSKLLSATKKSLCKTLLLSASICDKIIDFKPFTHVFGFTENIKEFSTWMLRQLKINRYKYAGKNLTDDEKKLDVIHKAIFPRFASRMKISELGDLFPKNQVIAKAYYLADHKEVDKLYQEINLALEDLHDKEKKSDALGRIIRARQRIELLKVPIFVDLAQEAIDNGYSIAIFVNYHDTMNHICQQLNCNTTISGLQNLDERQQCINDFQSNKKKVIVAQITSGGVGVSLHDIHGGHPRMSIISPTWSGIQMKQALGRIHRAGSKSAALQRIVYCAKTYEDEICKLINAKLKTMASINDGDLTTPNIPVEVVDAVNSATEKQDESVNY